MICKTWLPVIFCRSQASVKMELDLLSPAWRLMSTVKCLLATRQCTASALAWVCVSWRFPFLWLTSRTAETPVLPSTMGKHCSNTSNTFIAHSSGGWVLTTPFTFICLGSCSLLLLLWKLSTLDWQFWRCYKCGRRRNKEQAYIKWRVCFLCPLQHHVQGIL